MANLQKTIEILFGGKDNLSPTTKSITKELDSFESAVQGVAGPVGNFTQSLLKTEAAILAMGLAMAGVALNQAGTFQGSIEEIGTLFNGTTEEVKQLQDGLMDYARQSSASIEEINQATYIAISTGTDWTEVNIALAASEQLATAGATDLATATGALSRVMNAYGLSAAEAQSVSEALFTAVQNGDTTMEELANNIGKVATIAKGSGVDLDVLLSAVSAITIAGEDTATAMTLLKNLFQALSNPSKELTAALGGMSLETNSLQEIMQVLKEKTGGSFEEFNKLFPSIRASQAAMILANDSAGAFEKTLAAMEDRSGKLSAAYERMSDTFSNVNQVLVNNLRVTLIQTGLPLLDEYGDAVKALTAIFAGIGKGVQAPNFGVVYDAIERFVNEFSDKMNEIAGVLPEAMAQIDFTSLIRSFGDLSDVVGESFDAVFGDDLDLSKPEDLAKALQKGVNILNTFIDLTTGIITGFRPVFDVLGEAGERLGSTSEDAAKATGEVLGSITLLKEFGTALGTTLILINQSKADITNVFSTLEGLAKIVINSLQLAFDSFALGVVAAAKNLVDTLNLAVPDFLGGDKLTQQSEELQQLMDGITENFKSNLGDMGDGWDKLSDGLSGDAVNKAGESLDELGNKANEVKSPVEDLSDTMDEFAEGVEVVPSTIPDVTEAMDDMAESTKNADEVQKGIVKTMVDGVPTFTQAKDATKELAEETDKSREAAEKLLLEYARLEVEMEEIASNERIKNMEFFVELETAKVEADAKKVVAAFESISESYSATSSLIGELYSNVGDLDGLDQFHLENSIKQAEKIAQEQHEMQMKLSEAQLKQIEAQIKKMESGDALITVEGGELQPELEAIMQSLFKSIRIKMSSDYENFLLGLQ